LCANAAEEFGPGSKLQVLLPIQVDGKVGLIDSEGNVVIEPSYLDVHTFTDDKLTPAETEEGVGYIDRRGEMVLQPECEDASPFSNDLAAVKTEEGWRYIDRTGATVIAGPFEKAGSFSDKGVAVVKAESGYGMIDRAGEYVLLPNLRIMGLGFGEQGWACGKLTNGECVYVSSDGMIALRKSTGAAFLFQQGLAPFRTRDGKWGYMDRSGAVVIAPTFKWAHGFAANGLAAVLVGRDTGAANGYIDRTGEFKIKPRYRNAGSFASGLAAVQDWDTEKWGYINEAGEVVIPFRYLYAMGFVQGAQLARVYLTKTETGYIASPTPRWTAARPSTWP